MFFLMIMMICSVSLFASVAFVYAGKGKEKNGTVLSVHLPQEGLMDSETKRIAAKYQSHMKKVLWVLGITGALVTALAATRIYTSIYMILYAGWCIALYWQVPRLYKTYHRKMYDWKEENHWLVGKRHIVAPDTEGAVKRETQKNQCSDRQEKMADEDEYWKNGYYYNPQDKHWWVPDHICSSNYTLNMACPAAKVMGRLTWILVTVLLAGLLAAFLWMDFAEYQMDITETQVNIKSPFYSTSFEMDEVEEIQLMDSMPDVRFIRTNGADTSQYLLGNFTLRGYGQCKLYIYKDYAPVLLIKLKDRTIFFNSKKKGRVEELYRELKNSFAPIS